MKRSRPRMMCHGTDLINGKLSVTISLVLELSRKDLRYRFADKIAHINFLLCLTTSWLSDSRCLSLFIFWGKFPIKLPLAATCCRLEKARPLKDTIDHENLLGRVIVDWTHKVYSGGVMTVFIMGSDEDVGRRRKNKWPVGMVPKTIAETGCCLWV